MNLNHQLLAAAILLSVQVWSQPGPIPPGANANCTANPGTDTLPFTPDSEGFSPLFDGTSLKGWWESCQSGHSSGDQVKGGIWLVDAGLKALFSNQNPNGAGGLLLTNKKFTHYELIFDVWPDFNNDAGVFNRTTANGTSYQTTLDYISGSSIGGTFGENGYGNFNIDPYKFGGSESSISNATWTSFTAGQSPATFGCSASGCTPADWTKVWDINGWNQMRIKFYGGLVSGNQVHMESWIRDLRAPNKTWVPLLSEARNIVTPANHIGLQIHGGSGSWQGQAGNWYRNMKWRPLDDTGKPTGTVKIGAADRKPEYRLAATPSALQGRVGKAYQITATDLGGRVVERFSGDAGAFRHEFTGSGQGVLLVQLKTAGGVERLRVSRIP